MKNAIFYYYHLNINTLIKKQEQYEFDIDHNHYVFLPCPLPLEEIIKLYQLTLEMYQHQIPVHQMILNKDQQFITYINQMPYLLLQVFVKRETLILNDILRFQTQTIQISLNHLSKANWYQWWTTKIDYLEYQMSEFGKKYPIIRESFCYYIGLAENAVSLLQNIPTEEFCLAHRRLYYNSTLFDLCNPLNFIVDSKVRDVAEYLKDCFFHNQEIMDSIQLYFSHQLLSGIEYQLFFIRFLFPSYYFDCYETIIENGRPEKEILTITLKNEEFEQILKYLYQQVKNHIILPEIQWLK